MYICIYMYIHDNIHACAYSNGRIHALPNIYVPIHLRMYLSTYVSACIHVHIPMHAYTHSQTYIHAHTCIYMHIHGYTYTYVGKAADIAGGPGVRLAVFAWRTCHTMHPPAQPFSIQHPTHLLLCRT